MGDGSLASISNTAFQLRGATTGTLSGAITENVTSSPIGNVSITITTGACLGSSGSRSYTVANSDATGNYSANLEAGNYFALFQAVGRTTPACVPITITASTTQTLNQTMSRQGFISWDVRDSNNQPLPAKISLLYDPQTARLEGPSLGSNQSLIGGYSVLSATGNGTTPVPPGSYKAYITRGMEYEPVISTITVTEAITTSLAATLQRVVLTPGYLSADMHVHGFNSADSAITWEDRARQAAAEGLEIVVPTDHDYISQIDGAIATAGVQSWVSTVPGDEVTTNEWGHFNAYPLTPNTSASRNGALDHLGLSPSQIFQALRSDPKSPVVQVNHPRAGGLGYFDQTALNPVTAVAADPSYSSNFDALEVFNGKRLYQVPQVLNDWYRILNRGQRVVGVGNTDTHQVFGQELGYPRNFVYVATDNPLALSESGFRDAIKAGRTIFTNGPFVEISVNGSPMGSLVGNNTGSVPVRVTVQAPAWMTVDTVKIVVNGLVAQTVALSPATGVVSRLDQTYPLTITKDSWIAVEVDGGNCNTDANNNCLVAGCPGRLDPVVPPLYGTDPVCPFAHTNAIFIDTNNNNVFDPPGNSGLKVEPISATRAVNPSTYENTRLNGVVTVQGVVTAGSYTYDHRANAIAFQDTSLDTVNKLSGGSYIFQSSLIKPVLEPGDLIQTTGTVTMFNGLLELSGVATEVLAKGKAVPTPLVLTIAQITDANNREQWESMLVRINNVSITGGSWPGFGVSTNLTINDGSGSMQMRIDSDTDIDGSLPPTSTFDLIATVGQFDSSVPYNSGYQLLPRDRDDVIDSSAPIIIRHGPAADPVSSCEATIRWYTNKVSDSTVEYGLTSGYGTQVSGPSSVFEHSVTLPGLTANTLYHYRVISNGIASPDAVFTTAAGIVPQLTQGPTVQSLDSTTVQITWRTDLNSSSIVRYGRNATYGSTVTGPPNTAFHYATISGLTPGTTYHYRVESASPTCGAGTLTGADNTFSTPLSPAAPPEVSGNSSAVPFTINKVGGNGLEFRFEYRGTAVKYHLYGAPDEAAIDNGNYSVKLCDLAANPLGTFATDNATFVAWTIADGSVLPEVNYVVVAESGALEGAYGVKSNGDLRTPDADKAAPTQLGCPQPCSAVSAAIVSVTPSSTVALNTAQTFTGSGTGEGALTYAWDFDYDGTTFDTIATGSVVTYTYPTAGSRNAALRVTDSCNNPSPQNAIDTEPITITSPGCAAQVVISQVYGGGGNSGATYRNDFIELFNRGGQPQSLAGWSVQYASSTGTTWAVTNLSGTIPAGGYYLVQEAQGAGGTTNLPTPDATGTIAMSGTTGKVALVTTTTALTGSCPAGATLKDFVGYGSANCFEGAGAAPALTNTTSDSRNGLGCNETNNNNSDFTAGSVNPRNSSSANNQCSCP
ncbi:MAG: CehA/McbA family metallohydrolase [Acidobacteriota bacterium]